MYIDVLLRVSSGQAVTADAVSTSSIDFSGVTPKLRVGTGEPVGFGIFITAVGTQTGSSIISAISSAAAALTSPVLHASLPLLTADLALGKAHFVAYPPGTPTLQYGGLDYDITGTVDHTVTAALMPASTFAQAALAYAKGYTIS